MRLIGGAAVPWPFAARAQQTRKVSRIGYLGTSSSSLERRVLDAFRQTLRELGYVEGETIAIDYRWAEGQDDELPQLAAALVRLKPDVIVTTGTPGTLAAKQATDTIPIVFSSSGSPVNAGLVASYARPGGNVTGLTFTGPELEGKRLQILKDVVPGLSRVAVLWNAASMGVEFYRQTEAAAAALSVTLQPVVQASRMDDFERAFETIGRARPTRSSCWRIACCFHTDTRSPPSQQTDGCQGCTPTGSMSRRGDSCRMRLAASTGFAALPSTWTRF